MNKQSEHDAVGAALAAYEHALDTYSRLLAKTGPDAPTDRVLEYAQDDIDNLAELVTAAREAAGVTAERITPKAPAPPAETAWLRDITLEW